MKGFAQKLFEEREKISLKPNEEQTYLHQLLERGVFEEIDLYFADYLTQGRKGCKKEQLFLAALFASSRQGDLCLQTGLESTSFIHEKGIKEQVKEGAQLLSSELLDVHPNFIPSKPVCRFGSSYYLQKNWVFETRFIFHLERKLRSAKKELSPVEREPEVTEEQQAAINKTLFSSFSLLCGGPGTGKTFTAAKIVSAFLKRCKEARIYLAAPTGKAARQLKRSMEKYGLETQVSIGTVHALLEVKEERDYTDERPPLEFDLILVDECSMLDAKLFSLLLSSVKDETTLVLGGDPQQLPPVESGTLFADLVDVLEKEYPEFVSRLTNCLRSDEREILHFAQAVIEKNPEEVLSLFASKTQGALIYKEEEFSEKGKSQTLRKISEEVRSYFPGPSSERPEAHELFQMREKFCFLSCLRKGPFGVDALNEEISTHYLGLLRKGEYLPLPILLTRTDEKRDLFNGETGFLIRSSEEEEYALFGPHPWKKIRAKELPSFEYAYCMSVHKSQGSEYERVFLLVPPGAERFGKEVIYTGATRAKKQLKIISGKQELVLALGRASRKISSLHARLKKNL
jgi:exodeoxyribonuclease V alpha subunit